MYGKCFYTNQKLGTIRFFLFLFNLFLDLFPDLFQTYNNLINTTTLNVSMTMEYQRSGMAAGNDGEARLRRSGYILRSMRSVNRRMR